MIDASLYSQIQAPKQTNMLEQFARMQQIQGAQSQNRLADLMYGKEEREAAGSMAVDAAYKDATGADGTIDRKKLYAGIAKISGSKLPGVQKGFAETDNVEVLAQKNKIGLMREKLSMAGQILGSVKDQASYDAARQSAAANGLDVANMPPQYNPDFVAGKLKEAMTVKEQLEQHWKQMEYSTPNANAVLSAKTSTDNNRASVGASYANAAAGRAQSAAQHAQTLAQGGKPTAGYRFTADGNMQAIPGGPADAKTQTLEQNKLIGATDVDVALGTLRDAYDRLEKGGGITSTGRGALGNLSASSSSSGIGQVVGRALGTNNQSARNDIVMTRPALLAALMKATGMSAKQMDSNAELKLWLSTATDPTLDVESNRRALSNIEKKYITGPRDRVSPSGGGAIGDFSKPAPNIDALLDKYK